MASELPDALEKLALKAERSENEQGTSLSKYFGQPDITDDIFDTISKPPSSGNDEPKINFFKSPSSTPVKEDTRQNNTPTFAFKKGEEESEPKIFSYFSQTPVANQSDKSADGTEFFDQISQLASKSREPIEISNPGFSTTPQSIATCQSNGNPTPCLVTESVASVSLPSTVASSSIPAIPNNLPQAVINNVPQVAPRQLFTPHAATLNQSPDSIQTEHEIWSQSQKRASNWWIPNPSIQQWLQSPGSIPPENLKLCYPGLLSTTEFV